MKPAPYVNPYCALAAEDPERFEEFHRLCPGGRVQRTEHGEVLQVYTCAHSCHYQEAKTGAA